LINFEPGEEAMAMETYRTWARLFELQQYYSWIIDRFHISTQVYQIRERGKYFDFTWLEERLLPLGFRLVHCTRQADSFEAARAVRLAVSGNPAQYRGCVEQRCALCRHGDRRLAGTHGRPLCVKEGR
jgi:hypothetical protein